jgi:uncharacterized protein (TIGR03382 family)
MSKTGWRCQKRSLLFDYRRYERSKNYLVGELDRSCLKCRLITKIDDAFNCIEISTRLCPLQILGKQATSTAFKARSCLRILSLECDVGLARKMSIFADRHGCGKWAVALVALAWLGRRRRPMLSRIHVGCRGWIFTRSSSLDQFWPSNSGDFQMLFKQINVPGGWDGEFVYICCMYSG